MRGPAFLSEAGLVHEPQRDALIGMGACGRLYGLEQPPFSKAAAALGFFCGWTGRAFWRERWFLLIQPAPLPERLIGADPEFFLRTHIEGQSKTPGSTSEALFQEYLRCYLDPATRHAICEVYRAAATIDLDHDAADVDRRMTAPLLALWGAKDGRRSMMCWRPGAGRSMCAGGRSTAGTRCRRRRRRKP